MEKGYEELYAAIWRQAVEEDTKEQRIRLFFDVTEAIFPYQIKYQLRNKETYKLAKQSLRRRYGSSADKLIDIISNYRKDIKKAVQRKVYEEALEWPYYSGINEEYEKEYEKIRDSIVDTFNADTVKEA